MKKFKVKRDNIKNSSAAVTLILMEFIEHSVLLSDYLIGRIASSKIAYYRHYSDMSKQSMLLAGVVG